MIILAKRAITAEDLYKMKFTGNPALSPDGSTVIYVVTEVSEKNNGYSSSLYISEVDGSPHQLTHPYGNEEKLIRDTKPKWSPSGEAVAFLSNRGEKQQIWLLPMNGGEAHPVTDSEEGVNDFNWSPDGKKIVYTTKEMPEKEENEDVIVVTRLRYKGNGEGYRFGYSQIMVKDLETAETTQLTSGPYDHHSPSFSPSGKEVLYLASKNEDRELVNISDLFLYDLESGTETNLYKGKGPIANPSFSPDGKYVAFAGHDRGEISSSNLLIWLFPTDGGEAVALTGNLDRPVGNYVGVDAKYDTSGQMLKWEKDSNSILFLATYGGDCYIKRVGIDGNIEDAAGHSNSVINSFDVENGTLSFVKADPHSSGDLFVQKGKDAVKLTDHNGELFEEIKLSTPERILYKGADDWDIEGWVLPPLESNGKAPVLVEIHGGPHTSYGNGFHHEFQWLAAKGYAVVYTNPRGSHGYGEEFLRACVGDWGNKDRQDIMNGLDYVLEHFDFCDPDSLYVTGGSYGGIMTNFIVTNTDRFRAAVTQRCISNMYSFFGTSDIGFYFGYQQLGGADQWEDEETIMQFSPIRKARNVKTPTCIIHAEEDYRCPMEQAEQWYVALKRLGVDTKLIRFKGENHELSRSGKPKNRVRRLEEIADWFEKH
ncbi:MAG TPA: S9 family peptidase [Bacillales bacterium]|nr:S9 family peptidase [Bacillales bacterium]